MLNSAHGVDGVDGRVVNRDGVLMGMLTIHKIHNTCKQKCNNVAILLGHRNQ
jgi:hypothetical protein